MARTRPEVTRVIIALAATVLSPAEAVELIRVVCARTKATQSPKEAPGK